jgi:hypothetical protein
MPARFAITESQIAIERLQIQNLMRAKADATERYEKLRPGSPVLRSTPQHQTAREKEKDAIEPVNTNRSGVETRTRALATVSSMKAAQTGSSNQSQTVPPPGQAAQKTELCCSICMNALQLSHA